jgi:hypothetical protein
MLETKELAFLKHQAAQGLLEAQTLSDVNNGKIKLVDTVQTLRVNIKGAANNVELLTSSVKFKKGTSDWDGNKLPAKENLLTSVIRVGYGTHATETDPAKVTYQKHAENVPAAFLNASILVKQDSKTIIKLPISSIMSEVKATDSVSKGGYELKSLQMLRELANVSIELDVPEGTNIGTAAEHFIEVSLVGQKTTVK